MHIKVALSVSASIISIVAYYPYLRDILKGKTKPHAFSWVVWSLVMYIAGYAQVRAGGGAGAAVTFVTATISLAIAILAFRDGSITATKSDWVSFIAALSAIPIWVITKQPLLSVIVISFIDTVAFWPTIRKSYSAPHQENVSTHTFSGLRDLMTIAALQKYNWTTALYPAVSALTNILLVLMLIIRRISLYGKV